MNKLATCFLLFIFCGAAFTVIAQKAGEAFGESGGEYLVARNSAANPCVTLEQYRDIEQACAANAHALGLDRSAQKGTAAITLSWPLRLATGITDCSYYGIGAYVDQDTATTYKDFNCGTDTYDGHKGTDIFIWPYPFYKMDHNQVEVVAAAPGTIINKADGNFDKNCASNSLNPNYISIKHADGSTALYLHMKSGSLTTKAIGATVAAGEFLGIVGSSGSSTGPHLHFEVWSGSTIATRIDPYSGTCNKLNAVTWWAAQKPYRDPAVVKASIHKVAPVVPACPATETPNEDTCFSPGASVVYAIWLRDETNGTAVTMSLLDPAGATLATWTHNCTVNIAGSYWTYSRTLPTIPGIYTFKTVYNSVTCAKTFKVDCSFVTPVGIAALHETGSVDVAPIPAHDAIHISGSGLKDGACFFTLKNVIGQTVAVDEATIAGRSLQKNISLAAMPAGVYFLTVESSGGKVVRRVVKED